MLSFPKSDSSFPISIHSPFITQQLILQVPAKQHLLLLLGKTFPGTESSVVIPLTPHTHPHTKMLSFMSACLRIAFLYFSVCFSTQNASP